MNATKATEQKQYSQSQNASLNDRYGKIGISAVAGAVQHKRESRPVTVTRFTEQDSD